MAKAQYYARHRIKFRHIRDEIHLVRADRLNAHDEPGSDVENREKNSWEVVGHEGVGGPVVLEKHIPSAKLCEFVSHPVLCRDNEGDARRG